MKLDVGRYEVKYAVPTAIRDRILEAAGGHMVPDPHGTPIPGGGLGYVVHSTYFDTATLDDYTSRLCDQRVRRRMRVRTYGAPGERQPVFLELKRKLDDQVIKQRAQVCDADRWASLGESPWEALIESCTGEARAVACRFASIVREHALSPVTSVHYEREVFVDVRPQYAQVRLTIDRAITASARPSVAELYPQPEVHLLPDGWSVLELKFDGAEPGWMRAISRELQLCAEPVSKYALAVATCLRAAYPREARRMTPHSVKRSVA